jgi:hypothetical protein
MMPGDCTPQAQKGFAKMKIVYGHEARAIASH